MWESWSLRNLTHTERLKELCLTILEIRRRRGDLISMFRYFKGFDKINFVNPPKILIISVDNGVGRKGVSDNGMTGLY